MVRAAVGVAATPESIEFIRPGEDHPLLGKGIPGAVVLSAGGRLRELRKRIEAGHGRIDAAAATITVDVSHKELTARAAAGQNTTRPPLAGTLEKYAALVGPANLGAVTHSGNVVWERDEQI